MNLKLLIADAEDASRHACRDYFLEHGFRVCATEDGVACLVAVSVLRPDVLVVDADMPLGNGDGVLPRLRRDGLLDGIPVVVATGCAPRGALAERTGLPRACCLPKPVDMETLRQTIGLRMPVRCAEDRQPGDAALGKREGNGSENPLAPLVHKEASICCGTP